MSNVLNRNRKVETFNKEAEEAVITCLITDNNLIPYVSGKITSDYFYSETHSAIFKTIVDMYNQDIKVDIITLYERVSRINNIEISATYLSQITRQLATTANIDYYIDVLKDKYFARKMEQLSLEVLTSIDSGDYNKVLPQLENELQKISEMETSKGLVRLKELRHDFADFVEGKTVGETILTGFDSYDNLLSGLRKGDMTVIAARPGVGKTSLALNIAHNIGKSLNRKIAFFSMEMTSIQCYARLTSITTGIDSAHILNGKMTNEEVAYFTSHIDKVDNNYIYIDDSATLEISDLLLRIKKAHKELGLDVVFIDYIQKLEHRESKTEYEAMKYIIQQLKAIAKRLNIAIVCIAQMNRGIEHRKGDPVLSDVRGSGYIEQEADVIMFLTRPDLQEETKGQGQDDVSVKVVVAKNRNGETGSFYLNFTKSLQRYSEFKGGYDV